MNKEEIIDSILRLLRLHKDGLRGSIHQDPYKSDLFQQFSIAFNEGYLAHSANANFLSAEVLREAIAARDPDLLKHDLLPSLHSFWNEWAYAWNHLNLRK